jgi:hypothetical protein
LTKIWSSFYGFRSISTFTKIADAFYIYFTYVDYQHNNNSAFNHILSLRMIYFTWASTIQIFPRNIADKKIRLNINFVSRSPNKLSLEHYQQQEKNMIRTRREWLRGKLSHISCCCVYILLVWKTVKLEYDKFRFKFIYIFHSSHSFRLYWHACPVILSKIYLFPFAFTNKLSLRSNESEEFRVWRRALNEYK